MEKEAGTGESEVSLKMPGNVSVTAKLAAYLPAKQDSIGEKIANTPITDKPYWDIERRKNWTIAKSAGRADREWRSG
jgi:hypothetical protein